MPFEATRKPSMIQSAILMNDAVLEERLKLTKGSRLESLLRSAQPKSNADIVDQLYLAAISRLPDTKEKEAGIELLREYHEQGAEDLLWVLVNRLDFLFY